ncbi:hypothetical protein [Allosphingosinicella vermicomposti]|uniref:hypothetical protein n=1 Tax=Allosphingosinicella vermicomposti TaxID=614671 RepID=UPI00131A601A|nr:hypothetical protein [Allosphingosinicella vermicomposti]
MKPAMPILAALSLTLACCGGGDEAADNGIVTRPEPAGNSVPPPAPPGPDGADTPPDDRAPLVEAPVAPDSPQAAAKIVQSYYALIGQGRYSEAWALWSDGGRASGMDADAFAESFARFADYHADVGAPGPAQGAAGSIYVTVSVRVYGRLASGEAFNMAGPVTLRRVNDVPGSTEEQRRWHIAQSEVKPLPN